MSEITPLNDPELNQLEQRLRTVKLEPTAQQRERLLYSCGLAAGRAQVSWRVRVTSTTTVMLAFVCVGLSYLLLTKTNSKTNQWKPMGRPVAEEERKDSQYGLIDEDPQIFDNDGPRHLRVGSSFDEFMNMKKLRKAEPSTTIPPGLSPKRILTATGGSWLDDL